MVKHALTHLGSLHHDCGICGKRLKTRSTLRYHIKSHDSEEQLYKVGVPNTLMVIFIN